MRPALTKDDKARFILENLGDDARLRPGLSPRTFVANTADTTVLSYPKSGKTWVSYMVTAYIAEYLGCPPKAAAHVGKKGVLRTLSPEVQERYVGAVATHRTADRWAPLISFGLQDSLGTPFFATKDISPPRTERTIILLRDPRDIVVSHFHHVTKKNSGVVHAAGGKRELPKDYEIGEFLRSDFLGIRHILSYAGRWSRWAIANGASIFFYEDFVAQPKATLRDFLLAAGVSGIDPAILRKSIDNAAFDRMAQAELRLHEKLGVEDTEPSRRRMRKGKVGGYVDEVSEEDAAFMTRVMTNTDIQALRRYLDKSKHSRRKGG